MPPLRTARPIDSGAVASDPVAETRVGRFPRWRRALGVGALLTVPALGVAQDGAGSSPTRFGANPTASGPATSAAPAEGAAASAESVVRLDKPRTQTEIVKTYAKRVLLPPGLKWTDAGGFDENVVTVTAEDNTSLRLYAASPGVTQVDLLAVDSDGNQRNFSIEVLVTADARALQAAINRLFPGTAVEVYGLTDTSVVLRGWITRPEQVSQIVAVAGQYFPAGNILNQMRVAAPQQVQLNVVFMEVQRSKAQELGINLSWFGKDGFFSSTVGDVVPLASVGGAGNGTTGLLLDGSGQLGFPTAALANPTLAAGVIGSSGVFQAFLRALREERLLKVLSEPVQVASNGRPSYFQAGGEFPIPIPQGLGSVGIEYRPYGVELSAVPIILGGGRVRLELAASVSDLDFSRGTTIQGTTVPGLSQRQTNTQVELEFGKTLMIAGLIQNTQQAAAQKVPFLGELPGIGAAFRRVKYEEAETELVILVTPHPVAGLNPSEVPCGGPGRGTAAPTTRELFGLGIIEAPGADPCGPGSAPGCGPAFAPACGTACGVGAFDGGAFGGGAPGGYVGAGYPASAVPQSYSDQPGFPGGSLVSPISPSLPSSAFGDPAADGQAIRPLSSPNLNAPQLYVPQTPGAGFTPGRAPGVYGEPQLPGMSIEPAPAPIPNEGDAGSADETDGLSGPEASRSRSTLGRLFGRPAVQPASHGSFSGVIGGRSAVTQAGYQAPPQTSNLSYDSFGTGRVTAPAPTRR